MKTDKNIEELNKKWGQFGFRINDKGEITVIGEKDGKEYKNKEVQKYGATFTGNFKKS